MFGNTNTKADNGDETGAAVHEHSDTWGFSWMPAIEEFVKLAAAEAQEKECRSGDGGDGGSSGDEDLSSGEEESTEVAGDSVAGGHDGGGSPTQGEQRSAGPERVCIQDIPCSNGVLCVLLT